MRALLFSLKTLPFLCCLLVCSRFVRAQEKTNPVLVVNPNVGEVIDQEEKIRFNLFPFVDNADYQIGRFFLQPDKQIVLEIIKRNGQTETRKYTQTEFELTGQLIEAKAGKPVSTTPPVQTAPVKPPVQTTPVQTAPLHTNRNTFQSSAKNLKGRVFYVILRDGMKFFATIVEKHPDEYVFETQYFGTITASFGEIRYLKEVENRLRQNDYWIPNPHDSRLFFGPTGRGIPKGEGYWQNIYGYINGINYGVSDNFSIGTTFFLFPGLALENSIYAFTPKISLPIAKNVNMAAGVLYASYFGDQFGIIYGAGTIGGKHDHVTLGLGYTFLNTEVNKTPVFMFGGVKRVSNRISLMSENYLASWTEGQTPSEFKTSAGGGLYGVRFIWPRTSLDLAGAYLFENESNPFGPPSKTFFSSYILPMYFSFTMKFGTRRLVGKVY